MFELACCTWRANGAVSNKTIFCLCLFPTPADWIAACLCIARCWRCQIGTVLGLATWSTGVRKEAVNRTGRR